MSTLILCVYFDILRRTNKYAYDKLHMLLKTKLVTSGIKLIYYLIIGSGWYNHSPAEKFFWRLKMGKEWKRINRNYYEIWMVLLSKMFKLKI